MAYVPTSVSHVFEWFWDLTARRGHSESGPQPLSYAEIAAWSQLTGTQVLPEELRMLLALDSAYLSAHAEEYRAQIERNNRKPPPPKR